jgi:hypothetical protein
MVQQRVARKQPAGSAGTETATGDMPKDEVAAGVSGASSRGGSGRGNSCCGGCRMRINIPLGVVAEAEAKEISEDT